MNANHPVSVTLAEFTAVFVPFGILVVFALLWPEFTETLDLNRTKATIWAASILLIPALVLYPFRTMSIGIANLSHLYWTFAGFIFVLHAYWAVFVIFNGIGDTFKQMGPIVASVNFFLTIWWIIDVVWLWTTSSESASFARAQLAARVFVFLVFAVTLVALRGGSVRILGFVFIAAVLAALLVRLWARARVINGQVQTA